MDSRAAAVLDYWFGDLDQTPAYFRARNRLWFGASAKTDAEVREKFSTDRDRAVAGEYNAWKETPKGALALIILLDQFSLQLYREKPESYAGCALAVPIARHVIDSGWEWVLTPAERAFLYLPFEHSENIPDQEYSVRRFESLARDVPTPFKPQAESVLDYARRHARVVKRFGRFPDRNEVYGRTSTAEELAFLASDEAPF